MDRAKGGRHDDDRRDGVAVIAVLSGGVGAARLLSGLSAVMDPADIVAVVNTGDDLVWNTLTVCPDLDTVMYSLAGLDAPTGWGLAGETWGVLRALSRFGSDTWFQIGDQDLATHLYRSARLAQGRSLSEVTAELAQHFGVTVRLVPMSDDPVRTKVTLVSGEEVDFQEYFVHRRHEIAVRSVRFAGVETARAAPEALDALLSADGIVIAPSNPLVSIGPILAVPGVADVLRQRRDQAVAVSPIIEGRALKGPADRLLHELGHESSAAGVARLMAPFVSRFIADERDRAFEHDIAQVGVEAFFTDTVMSDAQKKAHLGQAVLGVLASGRRDSRR